MKKGIKRLIMTVGIVVGLIVIFAAVFCGIKSAFIPPDSFYESNLQTENFSQEDESSSGQTVNTDEPNASGEGTSEPADESQKSRELPQEVLNLTMADIKALQKKVPFKDKLAVLNILSTSLSAKEYTELLGMLSGGVTRDEIKKAYSVVNRKLSPENREKFWGYYDKYKHLIP